MTTETVQRQQEVTYLEAISQALDEEMTRDERVFLMGEDIGTYGGAFKITEGFMAKYGEWRVIVAWNDPVDYVGIAVRIDDGDHRHAHAARFLHGDFFGVGIDNEHGIRQLRHVLDAFRF